MSVRRSLYRVVFTLIVLPFLLFSLIITQFYSVRIKDILTESLQVVADAQVAEMTGFCEQQKDYLALIGAMDMSRAALTGSLDPELIQYLDNMLYAQVESAAYLRSLAILDATLRVAACSMEHEAYAADGVQPLIDRLGTQSFYISDVLTDASGGKTLIAIAPIEENGALLGYTLAEISLDFYRDMREKAELWNGATFYLLDGRRQIISAGTPEEGRDTFVTSDEERGDYLKQYNAIDFEAHPQGSFQYEVGGTHYVTYYSNVQYTAWLVMLSVNLDSYQAQRPVYSLLAVFLVLLCVALSIWIGRFASRRIVRPVQSISSTLKAIQETQDYTLRAAVGRRDELGNLASEINQLIDFIETENLYRTQQQRLLQEKAEQDALTKVMNKERIQQFLIEAMARHRADRSKLALLFVDIDDFKSFNTQYGHNVGDQVLLFLSSVLARETAGTVGRIGGDEFLVIVESRDCVEELEACISRIEASAGDRFVVRGSGTRLPVYCSIGAIRLDFARPGAEEATPEQLVNRADQAMYQAKNSGKRSHITEDFVP